MEYKGIEYQVVQSDSPTEWEWTVWIEGRQPRTGSGRSRTLAIAYAQIAIDRHLKEIPARTHVSEAGPDHPND
jgi:hypothetical protein